jgi:cytochrome d ubiquinol oxidase subunit II
VIVSALAGLVTIGLVWVSRFELSRVTGAAAVAAIIAGWAFAQRPYILPPELTIDEAAAGHSTLIAIVVSAIVAALLLIPSLALLYSLFLRGRFDESHRRDDRLEGTRITIGRWELYVSIAAGVFIIGALLNIFSQNDWQRGIGVAALLGGIAGGFALLALPPEQD